MSNLFWWSKASYHGWGCVTYSIYALVKEACFTYIAWPVAETIPVGVFNARLKQASRARWPGRRGWLVWLLCWSLFLFSVISHSGQSTFVWWENILNLKQIHQLSPRLQYHRVPNQVPLRWSLFSGWPWPVPSSILWSTQDLTRTSGKQLCKLWKTLFTSSDKNLKSFHHREASLDSPKQKISLITGEQSLLSQVQNFCRKSKCSW